VSIEENKVVFRRLIEETFNHGNLPVADELIASGYVDHASPSGKPITLTGISIDRFAGGQIVERWSQLDTLGLLRQLGVVSMSTIPAPG